jgi:hypothetical protein
MLFKVLRQITDGSQGGVASVFCVLVALLITKLVKLAKHTKGFFF